MGACVRVGNLSFVGFGCGVVFEGLLSFESPLTLALRHCFIFFNDVMMWIVLGF
jgi:hypothetical protein